MAFRGEDDLSSTTFWLPPPLIICGALAALLVPALLCFLGVLSTRFSSPGLRFRAAVLGGVAAVILSMVCIYAAGLPIDIYDVLAAFSSVIASILASFVAWSLIAWGFTLNMLMELVDASRPVDETEWADLYTHGGGYERLTGDRMGILLAARFVIRDKDRYSAAPAGKTFAGAIRLLQLSFGINGADQRAGV